MIAAVTLALGWINLRGIRQSAFVINLLTIAKLVPLALFILVGSGSSTPAASRPVGAVSLTQISTAALLLDFRVRRLRRHRRAGRGGGGPAPARAVRLRPTIIAVTAIMTLAQIVAIGTLPDLPASTDAARRCLAAVHGRGRGAAHQRGIGRVDDRQQHGRRC